MMFDDSSMNRIAADDAMHALAEVMGRIGWHKSFADLTEDEARQIAKACGESYHKSMDYMLNERPIF